MDTKNFTQTQAFKEAFSVKEQKMIRKCFEMLLSFLPTHPSSPWPKTPRRYEKPGYMDTVLVAWDATIGATLTFGPRMNLFLAGHPGLKAGLSGKRTELLETVVNSHNWRWLEKPSVFSVEFLERELERCYYTMYSKLRFTSIEENDSTCTLLLQDMCRLVYTAKALCQKEIKLYRATPLYEHESLLLSFDLGGLLQVHIIGKYAK